MEKIKIRVDVLDEKFGAKSIIVGLDKSIELIEKSYEWLSKNIDEIIQKAKKQGKFDDVLKIVLGLLNTTLSVKKWVETAEKIDEALGEIDRNIETIKLLGADWTQIDRIREIKNRILLALEEAEKPEELLRIVERNLEEARIIGEEIRETLEEEQKSRMGEIVRRIEEARQRGEREVIVHDLKDEEIARILETTKNIKLNPLRRVLIIGDNND